LKAALLNAFSGRVDVADSPAAVAHSAAEWITEKVLSSRAPVRIALSGGSTPKPLYALLASGEFINRLPWDKMLWFWGDERFVPYDHPESNYRMAWEAMLSRVPVPPQNIFAIPTDGIPEDAAQQYEQVLKDVYGKPVLEPTSPLFDITLLGLGEDGHTASLLPGSPVLSERNRWVAAVAHGRPEVRITLTYPALESSRHVAFLIEGRSKAAIFRAIRSGHSDVPAARLHPLGDVTWFVDRDAIPD
jgi:6-phosphogluconolactonase